MEQPKPEPRITEARALPPRPKSSSRKLAIFGALVVLAGIGVYLWVHSLNRVSTDDAQVDGHIIPISPKIYGKVLEVLVDDNQQVKQGQVLVRIDPRDYPGQGGSGAGCRGRGGKPSAGSERWCAPHSRHYRQQRYSS